MFNKRAYTNLEQLSPLNIPQLPDFMVNHNLQINEQDIVYLTKSAQKNGDASQQEDDHTTSEFNLEEEIKAHPDSLFVKCFAIKADETNDNGDYFPKAELKKSYATFVGVPVFTNHQNNDINQARGKVVHSWWDEERNGIMVIARVDAAAYPQLARGIKESYIISTSMGCRVIGSVCSICHNYATEPSGYCVHIKEQKTRTLSAKKQKCEYHKNGPEEQCPICYSTKNDTKTFAVEAQKAFEYNYGIKFIENSFVAQPACSSCGVTEVIDPHKFLAKVADILERLPALLKVASESPLVCDDKQCVKIASQQEIDKLNQALNLLADVSKSMLSQKEQIDLEFLSDLVKVLADLQAVTDELTEQGYGRLQTSSPTADSATQNVSPNSTETQMGSMKPGDTLTNSVPVLPQQSPQPSVSQSGRIQSGSAGSAGTVTMPALASQKKNFIFEKTANRFQKTSKKLHIIVSDLLRRKNNDLKEDIKIASVQPVKELQIPFLLKK